MASKKCIKADAVIEAFGMICRILCLWVVTGSIPGRFSSVLYRNEAVILLLDTLRLQSRNRYTRHVGQCFKALQRGLFACLPHRKMSDAAML